MDGSYMAPARGRTSTAFSDSTGGLCQTIELTEVRRFFPDQAFLYRKLGTLCKSTGGVVCQGVDHDQPL